MSKKKASKKRAAENVYSVSWRTIVKGRTEAEAKARAARKYRRAALTVTKVVGLPPEPDPKTHCTHGKLWNTYCDYC